MNSSKSLISQDPLAVANYVIKKAVEKGNPVTNLKLQKILFFLQAAFINEFDTPIMDTKFSRWPFGPVSKDVYYSFKDNGSGEIRDEAQTIDFSDFNILTPRIKLDDIYMDKIGEYTTQLLKYPTWKLVQKTHEQSLWSDYEEDIKNFNAKDYTTEEIKEYFSSHSEDKLWQMN